jgi:acetamidase/formamidase
MVLEVRIEVVRPDVWGWTWAGGPGSRNTQLNRAAGVADQPPRLMRWELNAGTMEGVNQHGHRVRLRPFLGTIGMAPAEAGWHAGWTPRATGGNMDCKELAAGSTLYLPIAVPGGLVSVGDGHALQADGEVCGMAIECPMERVDLRYVVRPDLRLRSPRADTPAGWITFGFSEDLDEAIAEALNDMIDLLGERYGLERRDALALASLVVDVRITQLVNGVRGAHAVLPHGTVQT